LVQTDGENYTIGNNSIHSIYYTKNLEELNKKKVCGHRKKQMS